MLHPFLAQSTWDTWTYIPVALALVLVALVVAFSRRYKRCPSNRILVIYGKTSAGRTSKTLHGGGAFVIPLIQDYQYLSLDPMQIEIPLEGALSIENIRVNVPSVFTVAIGTEPEIMENAAIRLLGLTGAEIMKQAEDIIFGQLRQVIASMKIVEINRDRDTFLSSVQMSLEPELKKIGLVLINVNIKDIKDESGYIEAIGRKAAAVAINQAMIDVSIQEKSGAIGVAEADREKFIVVAAAEKDRDIGTREAERERAVRLAELEKERIIGEQTAAYEQEAQVRDREREMRVRVADANAMAIEGENESKGRVAKANAHLKVQEAEAYQLAETRRKEAEAGVLEASYVAQTKAAQAEALKVEAETRAQLESVSRAQKAKAIVDAQADAESRVIHAKAEAEANYAVLEAEARGQYEILAKKGEGLRMIVDSCGGAQAAFQMLMLEHMDHLSETAAKAIANVKFDKVIVWDNGQGGEGGNAATGFLKGMAGALPPMMQIMKDIGGVEMPEFFGKLVGDDGKTAAASAVASAPVAADVDGDSADDGSAGPAEDSTAKGSEA
ncbi:MAG: flotillin [Planctomycetota bacterium]|jgi:flotillin